MVHELFGVTHAAADQRAYGHGCERRGNAEVPDRRADCSEGRRDAEHRQESGGEMAERAADARDDHVLALRPNLLQQARNKARRGHCLRVRFCRIGHPNARFRTLCVRFCRIGHSRRSFGTLRDRFGRIGQLSGVFSELVVRFCRIGHLETHFRTLRD